jgi:hypothetical protein
MPVENQISEEIKFKRKSNAEKKISWRNQASEKIKSQSGIISQVKSNVWMKKCFPGHLIASDI